MKPVTFGGPKELDDAFNCRFHDPQRALEICNLYLREHPDDPDALFSRSQTREYMGDYAKALVDINRVLELDPNCGGYSARGKLFHAMGDHRRAVEDFTHARKLNEENWRTSLDPHYRADSLARLGRLDEALADCAFIRDAHWMPALNGLPEGDKEEFIAEIKRRANTAAGNSDYVQPSS